MEEVIKLKELLELQLDDAHEAISKERELKLSVKRELAQYINEARGYEVNFIGWELRTHYKKLLVQCTLQAFTGKRSSEIFMKRFEDPIKVNAFQA